MWKKSKKGNCKAEEQSSIRLFLFSIFSVTLLSIIVGPLLALYLLLHYYLFDSLPTSPSQIWSPFYEVKIAFKTIKLAKVYTSKLGIGMLSEIQKTELKPNFKKDEVEIGLQFIKILMLKN